MDTAATLLPNLLAAAWLLPLVAFTIVVLIGPRLGPHGKFAAWLSTGAIGTGFLLSLYALFAVWLPAHPLGAADHGAHAAHASADHAEAEHDAAEHAPTAGDHAGADHAAGEHDDHGAHALAAKPYYSGTWYLLGDFGDLEIGIGYYIDSLTVAMFCMVTLIATCIHFYAMGYMHDELHDITDHEVTLANGEHLHRPGRYYRFFQYLSLFCFSMLGIVIAGNIAMVFVFWELVGICSYFLIGFYIERKSASNAANKAFIVNRVGDFGMIIGLMAIWGALGTFQFGDAQNNEGEIVRTEAGEPAQPGIFSLIRPAQAEHRLVTPTGMVLAGADDRITRIALDHVGRPNALEATESEVMSRVDDWRAEGVGHWLLIVAGLGIFCGCVGKSAQFPLHTWLPDAMEGPTPVSALVHSATMVAAGVYLVGRFFPLFTPEVLLVIAYIGCITLFIAATIAITATDIKRVLAYSTISQLGYMMLALGLGGWLAGVFHLFTHAFFKSLLFMCSGSVIHAVHTNEMTEMGGLRKKMPYTAYTMLIGCLAIIGAGLPFPLAGVLVGFSGFYSKDAIIEQGLSYAQVNPAHYVLFLAAAGGAALTAFYMFRMWFMTFTGEPRDAHRYDHAHESPRLMVYPLLVLAFFAVTVGWSLGGLSLPGLLEQARPQGTLPTVEGGMMLTELVLPNEHLSHVPEIKEPAGLIAFSTALGGLLLASVIYLWRVIDPYEVRQQFAGVYRFLIHKWWFDELYNALFVQPTLFIARRISEFDRKIIDGLIHGLAAFTKLLARLEDSIVDRFLVDGLINAVARRTWNLGLSLHSMQTGQLRQYVMFIVVGTVALFVLISFFWTMALAG